MAAIPVDVTNYLRSAQSFDEQFTAQMDKLCRNTVDKESLETGTSIDAAWETLKSLVGNRVSFFRCYPCV